MAQPKFPSYHRKKTKAGEGTHEARETHEASGFYCFSRGSRGGKRAGDMAAARARANRELGSDFDLSSFRHQAIYDEGLGRIEMRLISCRPQVVSLANREFFFGEDEYITTEYSYKYSLPKFTNLAKSAGFEVLNVWVDRNKLFSVQYLSVRSAVATNG